jgi:hypothetical protein
MLKKIPPVLLGIMALANVAQFVNYTILQHHWIGILNLAVALFCLVPILTTRSLNSKYGKVKECPQCGNEEFVHPSYGTDPEQCIKCAFDASTMTEEKAYTLGYEYGINQDERMPPPSCNSLELMEIFKMGKLDGEADRKDKPKSKQKKPFLLSREFWRWGPEGDPL